MELRIGQGIDIHQLEKGSVLTLGGVEIPAPYSSVGHSDADVLIHALCDAILGALNKRDIGYHFPDTDSKYKDISSTVFLRQVIDWMHEEAFELVNMDCTILLEKPKIQNHIPKIQELLANSFETNPNRISIKATTSEKLGYIGESKGIKAIVIVLLKKD